MKTRILETERPGSDCNRSGPWFKHPEKEMEMNSTEHSTTADITPDPLATAIRLYKRGLAEFNFRSFDVDDDDDAWSELANATYGPHLDVLSKWDQPATTAEAAMEALRITLTDDGGVHGCDAAVYCMIKAAHGYLKGVAA